MPIPRDDLIKALKVLEKASKAFRTTISVPRTDEEIRSEYAAVDGAIATVDGILSGEGGRTSFTDFLHNVGHSLVQAQQKLDEKSGEYLERLRSEGRDYVQPSVFRIPKVNAEMKCAFDKIDSDQVNLIFYRRTNQAKEQHQQTLSFELCSSPPPPEVLARLRQEGPESVLPSGPPSIALVLDLAEREEILDRLGSRPPLTRPVDRPRVLIWPAGGEKDYFLARAVKSRKEVGLWYYSLAIEEGFLIDVVPYDADVSDDTRVPLREWVLKLADEQARWLGSA